MMVEVFKTNVEDPEQAGRLLDQIHGRFAGYNASFDLEDCDRILRVASAAGAIHCSLLIGLLEACGFHAEVLPDELPPATVHGLARSEKGS